MNDAIGNNAAAQIRAYIERFERLQEERDGILEDQREIMSEAKSNGFNPKVLRAIIRKRKKDPQELQEEEALMEIYEAALGVEN